MSDIIIAVVEPECGEGNDEGGGEHHEGPGISYQGVLFSPRDDRDNCVCSVVSVCLTLCDPKDCSPPGSS